MVLFLYCRASARCLISTFSSPSMSAIVLPSFMVLCMILGEMVSFCAASIKKSLHVLSKGISFCMCLEEICELEKIFLYLENLFCWIFRALITLSLMVSELSDGSVSRILSIFSLGISKIISILSSRGQESLF